MTILYDIIQIQKKAKERYYMTYFKKIGNKYAELIYNINVVNNQVYYDDCHGCRFVTDMNNIVSKDDIDKQVGYNLFILKNNS